MPGYNNDQFYSFSSAKRKCMSVDEHSVEAKRLCVSGASGDAEPLPFGHCLQPQQQQQLAFQAWSSRPTNNNNGNAAVQLAVQHADSPMELQEAEPVAAAAAAVEVRCTTSIADIGMCSESVSSVAGDAAFDSPVRCYCRPSMDVIYGCHYYFSDYY